MGPETRLARLVRATAQGTLVGLICAAADFMCAPVAAHATPLNINFVLGLSLLVALGSAAGLTSLLPKHLILLLLAGTGYWLGTELTRGAYAQTLPLSSLWKFILAASFLDLWTPKRLANSRHPSALPAHHTQVPIST